MLPESIWPLVYLTLGTITGFMAGLFGIGGGLVLVPVLMYLFETQHFPSQYAMQLALGTSMATILFTSIASTAKHHQLGSVDWRVVRNITPGLLVGTALGTLTAAVTPMRELGIFFSVFVYIVAMRILLGVHPKPSRHLPGVLGMSSTGVFIGWISSLVSIGGGSITVPFLLWCNVPLGNAIGTSSAIAFPIAVGGTIGYIAAGFGIAALPAYSLGFIYLPALAWTAIATVVTAPLGARVTHHTKIELLHKLFAILLVVLATKLLLRVL